MMTGTAGRKRALRWACAAVCATACGPASPAAAAPAATETIVLLRHGEKPPAGLGQLDCQGLNRALALPAVIQREYGRPDVIFAPDPADRKTDSGIAYDYIRPLATIEPTAIAAGLPVDTALGVEDWAKLAALLQTPRYHHALAVVAWEHGDIVKLARAIVTAHGGAASSVPEWDRRDFDSLYVLRLTWSGAAAAVTFQHRHEGLDGLPAACPPARR
jgi:hypothetical protein